MSWARNLAILMDGSGEGDSLGSHHSASSYAGSLAGGAALTRTLFCKFLIFRSTGKGRQWDIDGINLEEEKDIITDASGFLDANGVCLPGQDADRRKKRRCRFRSRTAQGTDGRATANTKSATFLM